MRGFFNHVYSLGIRMLFLLWIGIFTLSSALSDNYEEELIVKDYGNGYSGLHFNFVIHKPLTADKHRHFHLFPKSLYQIIHKHNVDEFHLSMAQGFWDRPKWGPPFVSSAPGGAEVWAWFSPQTPRLHGSISNIFSVDKSWAEFLEALSGQFCASLSHLGLSKNFISPSWSYRPSGLTFKNASKLFRYAQLPHEEVCTENLTPWAKLLPCKKLAGLASMPKPKSIYKATYNALHIDVRRICSDANCSGISLELRQGLTLVFDRRHVYRSITEPWLLNALLGEKMTKACPVASRSEIIVLNSNPRLEMAPLPEPSAMTNRDTRRVLAVYSPSFEFANQLLLTSIRPIEFSRASSRQSAGVSVMKYATGKGDVEGGIRIELRNHFEIPVHLVLLDSAPWYAEIYFSSLSITRQDLDHTTPTSFSPDKILFKPSVPRKRMSSLELVLTLPPGVRVTVAYSFQKILLRWNEYPPDANHGVYLPAASVTFQFSKENLERLKSVISAQEWELTLPIWASTHAQYLSANQSTTMAGNGLVRIYSETSLIRLPVPDFSMPFNALCLVCSVVAILFGSVHKTTTNAVQSVVARPGDGDFVDRPPAVRLARRVKAWLGSVAARFTTRKPHEHTQ